MRTVENHDCLRRCLLATALTCSAVSLFPPVAYAADVRKPELVSVRKIWDRAPHNAFTDLIRFQNRWFCVFREGQGHVSPDGKLRIITSTDGDAWTSAALIADPESDLRDAKITRTPDGRLMLGGAGALHQPADAKHQSMVWFSSDGFTWSNAYEIGDPNYWLWRITWHKRVAYSVGYATGDTRGIRLYRSTDGRTFDTHVADLLDDDYPNETAMVFDDDDRCYCLLRRDGKADNAGLLGTSRPPYKQWTWKDLGTKIGGPMMIRLPDNRLIAAVRLYGQARTALCWIDPQAGTLAEALTLPSGGDTSYPGMVFHDGLLWVSYYASHEGKTSIYLATVKIPPAR